MLDFRHGQHVHDVIIPGHARNGDVLQTGLMTVERACTDSDRQTSFHEKHLQVSRRSYVGGDMAVCRLGAAYRLCARHRQGAYL